jgi:hypothetical protein
MYWGVGPTHNPPCSCQNSLRSKVLMRHQSHTVLCAHCEGDTACVAFGTERNDISPFLRSNSVLPDRVTICLRQ